MLHVFFGSDREKVREALAKQLGDSLVMRLSDASPLEDVRAALVAGTSMFGDIRSVVLDSVCAEDEAREAIVGALGALAASTDRFFLVEEKPDADLKKRVQKIATTVESYNLSKRKEYPTVFKLVDAMKKGDKKNLWVGYQREIASGKAPEAIHGVLFWGAKQMLLAARSDKDTRRGRKLVAHLAELPHEARRRGEELEYALERFVLTGS